MMKKARNNWSSVSVAAVLAVMLAVTGSVAIGDTIAPTTDTYVNEQWSTASFGTSNSMGLGYRYEASTADRQGWTYLKFSLGAIPDGETITSAVLHLRITNNPFVAFTAGAFDVTDDSWSGSMTWNTRKTTAATAIDSEAITTTAGTWYSWNVTSLADADNTSGDDVLSICVKEDPQQTTNNTWAMFNSSEASGTGYDPYLEVTYTPEPATMALLMLGLPLALRRRRK
ncbi:MAG: DNRLRE domain-containing protein [Phycisphaerae bacterium]|nr:DNRLRE domain-containing protein [Phycisphaerae bacterium]